MNNRFFVCAAVIACIAIFGNCNARGATSTWILTASPGDWGDSNNWSGGVIADGADYTAYFSDLDIPAGGLEINVDASRIGQTIGNLFFGMDYDPMTIGGWKLTGSNTINMAMSTAGGTSKITSQAPGGEGAIVEISAPVSVAAGTNLLINGGGPLKFSGTVTVNDGNTTINDYSVVDVTGVLATLQPSGSTNGSTAIEGGATVNLRGSGKMTSGGAINVATGLGSDGGALNVGITSGESAELTANSGIYVGANANYASLSIHGTSTVTATAGAGEVVLGEWGFASGTLDLYDSATLTTSTLTAGRYNGAIGTVNLNNISKLYANTIYLGEYSNATGNLNINDSAELTTGTLSAGRYNDSGGTVTLNSNAKLFASNVILGDGSNPLLPVGGSMTLNNFAAATISGDLTVGSSGNGWLYLNDSSTVTVTGTVYAAHWGSWPDNGCTGTIEILGDDRVALKATTIDLAQGNWTTNASKSTMHVGGAAKVIATGDMYVGGWAFSEGTLNIDQNAQVTIGGQLVIHRYDGTTGTVNITAMPGETASLTAGSIGMMTSGWGGNARLNISGDAKVSTTTAGGASGDLTIGQFSPGWHPWADGIAISDNGSLTVAGNVNLSQTRVKLDGAAQMSAVGSVLMGQVGENWANIDTSGTSGDLTINGQLTLNRGEIKTAAITNVGAVGGVKLAGALYLNGGQITPSADNAEFMQGLTSAYVQQNGVTFMTWSGSANTNIAIAQPLLHDSAGPTIDGGLTLIGNGTLTLTGALTYTGTTKIDDVSTLYIDSPGTTVLGAIVGTGTGGGRLTVGGTNPTAVLTTPSINVSVLTIGGSSNFAAVPEPCSVALLAMAAMGLLLAVRKWRD